MENQRVTWEDQDNINAFSKLNWKLNRQEAIMSEKKQELSYIADSANELELCFDEDEKVLVKVGDVFASMPVDQVNRHLEVLREELSGQIDALDAECRGLNQELARLKAHLYSKFKDSIHLEAD
jgi:prefoldin subunit 4